eukprot:TRINITY_DN10467_c0_g1_i1.p1 TRINITY_DN10467_c0_g1~~TRINITY_DN10467_c0_g1_i1.p1  ORF type:complete len:377 (-),score=15.12 TRINITY_DN10467_c0_g1_i1:322-1452(-)
MANYPQMLSPYVPFSTAPTYYCCDDLFDPLSSFLNKSVLLWNRSYAVLPTTYIFPPTNSHTLPVVPFGSFGYVENGASKFHDQHDFIADMALANLRAGAARGDTAATETLSTGNMNSSMVFVTDLPGSQPYVLGWMDLLRIEFAKPLNRHILPDNLPPQGQLGSPTWNAKCRGYVTSVSVSASWAGTKGNGDQTGGRDIVEDVTENNNNLPAPWWLNVCETYTAGAESNVVPGLHAKTDQLVDLKPQAYSACITDTLFISWLTSQTIFDWRSFRYSFPGLFLDKVTANDINFANIPLFHQALQTPIVEHVLSKTGWGNTNSSYNKKVSDSTIHNIWPSWTTQNWQQVTKRTQPPNGPPTTQINPATCVANQQYPHS